MARLIVLGVLLGLMASIVSLMHDNWQLRQRLDARPLCQPTALAAWEARR